MELVRSGFSKSPASEGSWKEEEEEEEEGAPQVLFSSILLLCAVTTLWARVPLLLFVVWCAVFLSFVDRPEMLGIIACVYQKGSSTLVVVYGSGVRDAGLDGLRFLLASPGPGCSASWPIWTRRIVLFVRSLSPQQWHVQGWFYWLFCTSRCLSLPPVVRPGCSASCPVIKVVDFFFLVHRPLPMVLATMEFHQLHVDTVVDSLVASCTSSLS